MDRDKSRQFQRAKQILASPKATAEQKQEAVKLLRALAGPKTNALGERGAPSDSTKVGEAANLQLVTVRRTKEEPPGNGETKREDHD